jgi:hypothetical protein
MTTKPKTRKATAYAPNRRRARAISEAEFAAMDFEPWKGEINTELLPNDEQFTEDGLGHLRTCRFALVTMYKNKAELAEMLGQIENEDGLALMNSFEAAKNFFSRFSEFLDLAEARIIVAGSAYLQAADVADRLLRKIQRSHGLGA